MSEPEKKRLKLEVGDGDHASEDDLLRKVLDYRLGQLQVIRDLYAGSQSELFYLENEGDLLEFPEWVQKPNSALDAYLSSTVLSPLKEVQVIKEEPPRTPVPQKLASKLPGSSGPGRPPAAQTPEQLVERAKYEATVVQRIAELQRDGVWSEKRLPKVAEPQRLKSHWDYLLEEVQWLAADFVQERKWKLASARKCARMVQKYFQDKEVAAQKAGKDQELKLRKIASFVAKEIRQFWSNVEKLSEYKQNLLLEEKRKQMLNQHLNLIVQQTEEFSSQLAETLQGKSIDTPPPSKRESDNEFEPDEGSTDDEETIAKEENDLDATKVAEEIDKLKQESEIPIEDLLDSLPPGYFDSVAPTPVESDYESDFEFEADQSSDDDETTLQEQEDAEGDVTDHRTEIAALEAEQDLPIEELIKKYSHGTPECSQPLSGSESDSDDSLSDIDSNSDSESKLVEDMVTEKSEGKEDVGLDALLGLDDGDEKSKERRDKLSEAAELAETCQPKGNTLASAEINVKVPFLLKHTLREYQLIGLNWLATMYERQLNGILADEMGLGKTIQTISLLAWLACEKGIWGPHLIIVPTSVMLNWEMECKKWCPGLKVMTYYGSGKERKLKRTGWTKPNAFHVCITSYKLVVQDHGAFRRKQWQYIILDEAQNIKNFKSQRWQLLLNFSSQRRLLLTGTPLQNNLMELWSLMHFLMPSMFSSHRDFREWFSNPVTGMIEGNSEYNESIIKRLHKVLRPFLLRRLKSEVEKQLPSKYEHVVMCRLSKRQRYLYDDYMSRAKTRETLSGGNLLSVINVLMQLRKVCAHPNLFEPRPTISPFQMEGLVFSTASSVVNCLDYNPLKHVNFGSLNLLFPQLDQVLTAFASHRFKRLQAPVVIIQGLDNLPPLPPRCPAGKIKLMIKPQQPAGQSVIIPRPGIMGYRPTQSIQPLGVRISTPQPLLASPAPILPSPPIVSPGGAGLTARQPIIPVSTGAPCRTNGHLLKMAAQGSLGHAVTPEGSQQASLPAPAVGGSIPSAPIRIVTTVNRQTTAQPTNSPDADGNTSKNHLNGEEKPAIPPKPFVDPALQYDKLSLSRNNSLEVQKRMERKERLMFLAQLNRRKCEACPVLGQDLVSHVTVGPRPQKPAPSLHYTAQPWSVSAGVNIQNAIAFRGLRWKGYWSRTKSLEEMVKTPEELMSELQTIISKYAFVVPPAMSPVIKLHASHIPPSRLWEEQKRDIVIRHELVKPATILHTPASAMITQFPDPRLIEYDCGKLQVMNRLLRDLRVGKHRVLIFTQMTKMLDVLESFLTFHGHTYLRLDGSTKIDQRQALMERFNADKRIFCFILSTRSGGIGVNLTGADTVIFYDSDWNPTMDAQAQDRCHRIGQTRDVHIYRLISEKTIEENILKKANQKRLLGDLAIEGGNFTTAYFQKQTIHDLFDVDASESDAAKRLAPDRVVMSTAPAQPVQAPENVDKSAVSAWESALQVAEDETDVVAAKNLRAEVAAELTEFDENGPVQGDEEPKSKAELELQNLVSQLTPVEQYALKFIELDTRVADQLAQAEEELEERKRQWEIGRAEAAQRANQKEDMITYPRAEQELFDFQGHLMTTWAPPTPPRGDDEYYFDHALAMLYAPTFIPESELPPLEPMKEVKVPVKVVASLPPEDSSLLRDEAKNRLPKIRKEEVVSAPRSLFERPNPALSKLKRDLKLARLGARPMLSAQFGGNIGGLGYIKSEDADQLPEWHIHEDMALLNAVRSLQGLPLNLQVFSPALSPNCDLVSDMVNMSSVTYRAPKECKIRYFNTVVPREEGRYLPGDLSPKKFKKHKVVVKVNQPIKGNRPMRTAALFQLDNNQSFTSQYNQKYEILKSVANRRAPTTRPLISASGSNRNSKHAQLFQENGVFYDGPMTALQIAANKAERIAKEKARAQTASEVASAVPSRASSVQPSPQQSPNPPPVAQQQTISIPNVAPTTTKGGGTSVVVSVASLTPAQVQAAAQLIAGLNTMSPSNKSGTTTVSARSLTPAQLQLLRAKRLQAAGSQSTSSSTATTTYVAVQPSGSSATTQRVVTLPGTQGKQHLVLTKPGQGGVTRTIMAEQDVAALLKRQQALQAQKLAASHNQVVIQDSSSAGTTANQGQQFLAQVGSPGSSGQQMTSVLKSHSVPSSLSGATLTIPVSAFSNVSQIPQVRSQTVGLVRATAVNSNPRQITIQQPFIQKQRPQVPRSQAGQVVGVRGSNIQLGVQFAQGAQRVPVSMLQQVVRGPRVTLQPRTGQQPVRQTIQLVATSPLRASAPNVTVDQSGRFVSSTASAIRTTNPTFQSVSSPRAQTPPVANVAQTQEIRLSAPPTSAAAPKADDHPGTGGI